LRLLAFAGYEKQHRSGYVNGISYDDIFGNARSSICLRSHRR
jgi:hypothetical protein